MRKYFLAGFGLCAACATGTPASTHDRVIATTDEGSLRSTDQALQQRVTLKATPVAAMTAASSVYKDLGVELKLYDPQAGAVGNRRFSLYHRFAGAALSTYLGCGITRMGAGADSYRITMSLVTYVSPEQGGSSVQTRLEATGEDPSSSQGRLSCLTTGVLEQRVNDLIAAKIRG